MAGRPRPRTKCCWQRQRWEQLCTQPVPQGLPQNLEIGPSSQALRDPSREG